MNECKCGWIPPCYGSLEFAIYEEAKKVNEEWKKSRALHGKLIDKMRAKLMEGGFFDDTYHKVYGVNEQLCDLGKTIFTKNDKDMEEKKTKKMTKAEAFEYLKGKKVRTCGEPRLLEKKLMECGYRWMRGVTWENDDYEDFWAYFMGYDGLITFVDIECSDYYECHNFEEISADDILSIEIVEEKSEEDDALDLISTVGARLSEVLRRMKGHKHVVITEDDVILYDEGMSLFHSDPF